MDVKKEILLIEDEPTWQALLLQTLTPQYHIAVAPTLKDAKAALTKNRADLILLDFYLPDGNGFEMIDHLKTDEQLKKIPVILLTSESAVQIKVRSFSEGVYDFITKPFEAVELHARIASHLGRSEEINSATKAPTQVGAIHLDTEAKSIAIKAGNQSNALNLSPIEFKILQYLITHHGKARTREQLAKNVWNRKFFQSRTIDRHMSSIRKKLGAHAHYLQTVSQGGYRFTAQKPEDV